MVRQIVHEQYMVPTLFQITSSKVNVTVTLNNKIFSNNILRTLRPEFLKLDRQVFSRPEDDCFFVFSGHQVKGQHYSDIAQQSLFQLISVEHISLGSSNLVGRFVMTRR